jgi:hypothetical protein
VANPIQERYADALLERISNDRFPSVTQMNLFEYVASREQLAVYLLHLMDRIDQERNPSVPLLLRVQRLIARFGT